MQSSWGHWGSLLLCTRMRWGGGTILEVRIQAGFENDFLASWRKIREQKSLHLPAGKLLPLGHICSPLCLSAHWTLCTTALLSQYNPSHQCVVVLLLQKSQERLPSVSKCVFLSLQNAEPSSKTLIFAHTHCLQPSFFAGTAAVRDYSSSPCIIDKGFSNLFSGSKDGWCPLPASK